MAINSVGQNLSTNGELNSNKEVKNKGTLEKDDFLKLLLVELQHQDPTEPMDSEKILSQTSQLATLESAENTNKALSELAASLGNTQQFTTISAIGKTADLGSDAISHTKGEASNFEVYFPSSIQSGNIEVTDAEGAIINTVEVGTNPSGVYKFTWDGTNKAGNNADGGIYHINAKYTDKDGTAKETRLGAYPIESVRFDGGNTLVKLGSSYVPLNQVKEVY